MPSPFFFFAVLVALATLAGAIYFAFRPTERTLDILRPLGAATVFSSMAAFFLGLANGFVALHRALNGATDAEAAAKAWRVFLVGLAEAPASLILGFAILAVSWLLVAVGLRRQA